jgi:hypothetical protein
MADYTIFDCFRLFFPEQYLNTIIDLTNVNIRADVLRSGGDTNRGEFFKYIGIRLAMALDPIGRSYEDYWQTSDAADEGAKTTQLPRNYGNRFKMSKNRFKCIERNLQFGQRIDGDKWWRVRGLVEAFNNRVQIAFSPGEFVTVDELMSFWLGKDGAYYEEGLAHVTKMKAKPRGVGLMMKAMADGATNIICSLELQEGKQVHYYYNLKLICIYNIMNLIIGNGAKAFSRTNSCAAGCGIRRGSAQWQNFPVQHCCYAASHSIDSRNKSHCSGGLGLLFSFNSTSLSTIRLTFHGDY